MLFRGTDATCPDQLGLRSNVVRRAKPRVCSQVLTLDWFFIAFDLSFSTMSDEDAASQPRLVCRCAADAGVDQCFWPNDHGNFTHAVTYHLFSAANSHPTFGDPQFFDGQAGNNYFSCLDQVVHAEWPELKQRRNA